MRVPSRRSLRPDPSFDALIASVYPDLAACVARKQAAFALPEADIPASLTRPAAEILCRFLDCLLVIMLQCSAAGEGRSSWKMGSSSPEMSG